MIDVWEGNAAEWKDIVDGRNVYIYGAGNNAARLYDFLEKIGSGKYVKGFLVTEIGTNPDALRGLKVYQADKFDEKDSRILIQHTGLYRDEIIALLDREGYTDYIDVYQLEQRDLFSAMEAIDNPYKSVGLEDYDKKSQIEKDRDEQLRNHIIKMLHEGSPDFGASKPYQSLEMINLDGQRPTTYRIQKYGFDRYVDKDMNVLNIGCNTGFIDITISKSVKSITGIEYDETLASVGKYVAEKLNCDNVNIIHSDFDSWYVSNQKKYDAVFSLAIHHWLNLSSEEYARRLDSLLQASGYVWIESHGMLGGDPEYFGVIDCLKNKYGFEILCDDEMADDGLNNPDTARRFVIMRKG